MEIWRNIPTSHIFRAKKPLVVETNACTLDSEGSASSLGQRGLKGS